MAARDGQTLSGQSDQTQRDYRSVYCSNADDACSAADQAWENDHNNAIGSGGSGDGGGGGGSGDGGGGGGSGGGGGGTGSGVSSNPDNDAAALEAANKAAYNAYLNERLRQLEIPQFKFQSKIEQQKYQLELDRLRFDKAREAFDEEMKKAGLTGYYNGQPILQRVIAEAELTGTFGGKPTLARESMENQTALGLLNLLSQQHGPRNIFDYLRVLNGTPNGLRDILAAVSGRFNLPSFGGGAQNVPIQGQTLQSLIQDALGQGITAPGQQNTVVSPPGANAPVGQYNYTPTADGSYTVAPPGNPADPNAPQVSSNAPLSQSELAAQLTGNYGASASGLGTSPEDVMSLGNQVTRPSKFVAKDYLRLNPYQRDALGSLYQNIGFDPEAMQAEFLASLPKYGGPAAGRVVGIA